jgi:hypothetical protein
MIVLLVGVEDRIIFLIVPRSLVHRLVLDVLAARQGLHLVLNDMQSKTF